MSKHKALDLAERFEKWDVSDSDKEVAADTIRAQHDKLEQQRQLIMQMRDELERIAAATKSTWVNVAWVHRASSKALKAADQYLKDNP